MAGVRNLHRIDLYCRLPIAAISVTLGTRRYRFASVPMVRHRSRSIHHLPEAQSR